MEVCQCNSDIQKGNKSLPGNHHLISLTSVVGKLKETIIRDRMVKHLEDHHLINESQHCFQLLMFHISVFHFFNDIINMYNESNAVDVIYLGFQKAFDKVLHQRLFAKIKSWY